MKRFGFISRFTIAAGLAGAVVAMHFFFFYFQNACLSLNVDIRHVSVCLCKWMHTVGHCMCVTPLPAEALYHPEQSRAQLSELGGREAVINDWGAQEEISGAICKKLW